MVRRRYYRRRRGYRRGRRYAISRYNTFRYRSSKAQANQIYRINKKVNRIERETKPEIKTWLQSYSFNVGDYCNYAFGSLTQGQNFQFDGRLCRMQNVNAWFVIFKDPGIVGTKEFTATARIVVYQLREMSSSVPSTPNTIFNITPAERDSTDQQVRKNAWMRAIYGPLVSGISARVKILRDFKMTLSPVRERVAKKIVLKNKQIGNIERSNVESGVYNRGTIYWVCITSLNASDIAAAALKLQSNVKMAYIDES